MGEKIFNDLKFFIRGKSYILHYIKVTSLFSPVLRFFSLEVHNFFNKIDAFVWDNFRTIFRTIFGQFLDNFWTIFGQFLDNFWIISWTFQDNIGTILRSFCENFGTNSGSFMININIKMLTSRRSGRVRSGHHFGRPIYRVH